MGTSGNVGALSLPLVATGTANDALEDPVVDLLLAYVGHVLTADIDPKLADLPATASASCPATSRYGYDPFEPRAHPTGFPAPALWIWWPGDYEIIHDRIITSVRRRQLKLLYLFPELPASAATNVRRGLMAAVGASIDRWMQQLYHPTFSYNSKAAGQHLAHYVADLDRLQFDWKGGRGLPRVGVEEKNQGKLGTKQPGRDWPGFAGLIEVDERIERMAADKLYGDSRSIVTHDDLELFRHDAYGPLPEED